MEKYRALIQQEIDILIKQQCSSDNWKNIIVKEGFSTDYIHNVHFSGNIKLGLFEKEFTLGGGLKRHSGIYQASIHNCDIQDNVFIKKINNYIANYIIEENSFIENTNLIAVTENTSFGNGTKISVLNEGGGREILIADKLSSNLAYIMALYRHREKTINRIEKIIKSYSESINSTIGTIGKNVTITNCGIIKNTKIGNFAILNGVSKLTNGSINSNKSDPAFMGDNVVANNFIVSSGVKITEGLFWKTASSDKHRWSEKTSLSTTLCSSATAKHFTEKHVPFLVDHLRFLTTNQPYSLGECSHFSMQVVVRIKVITCTNLGRCIKEL